MGMFDCNWRRKSLRKLVIFFFLVFIQIYHEKIRAYPQDALQKNPKLFFAQNQYFTDEAWENIQQYLIADDHPAKKGLDKIFSKAKVIDSLRSMQEAGFTFLQSKRIDKIIVATHPKIPGYVIKAFLDEFRQERIIYNSLIKRIRGCQLIQKSISNHHYQQILKAPKKYLYFIPYQPIGKNKHLSNQFILVEDKMDIMNDKQNKTLWKSRRVTRKLLKALATVMNEVGLSDLAPRNCPFCSDGKVAFVDTAGNGKEPNFYKLFPYLSSDMGSYWLRLSTHIMVSSTMEEEGRGRKRNK